jgi:WD40 repeat protein
MESKIAMVGNHGYILIFDCLKNKLITSLQPAGHSASYKVDWNQLDPNFILMGSQSGKVFVMDLFDPKNLKVCAFNEVGSEVFGVCWNPAIRDEFLVGSFNGAVSLYNMNKGGGFPIKVFTGHEKRVFNVVFN